MGLGNGVLAMDDACLKASLWGIFGFCDLTCKRHNAEHAVSSAIRARCTWPGYSRTWPCPLGRQGGFHNPYGFHSPGAVQVTSSFDYLQC